MPSFKTHDNITFLFSPLIFIGAWFITHNWIFTFLIFISFIFSGLMFSGDIDLKSKQYKRWGLLRWIWIPYQRLIPHRSSLSHGLIIGTIFRLSYLSLVIILFLLIVLGIINHLIHDNRITSDILMNLNRVKDILFQNKYYLLAIFVGVCIGGISHTITDQIYSLLKIIWKKIKD